MNNLIKNSIIFPLLSFGSLSSYARAEDPIPIITYDEITYQNTDKYCFNSPNGSTDLSRVTTLNYHLIVQPENQGKSGDIFLGFRKKSAPDELWLYGIIVDKIGNSTKPDWYLYNPNQPPPVYLFVQDLPAITRIDIINKPIDLQQLEGEVFVGYGLRKASDTTSPENSFKEMLDSNRYETVHSVDAQITKYTRKFICLDFSKISVKTFKN